MAAQVYPTAIYFSLIEGDYNKAKSYMNIFENQSGLFDSNGNIRSGREHYYYSKGLYYIGVWDVDSAEYYYRKLIPYGYLYEAYKGLLSVYTSRKETDSIGNSNDFNQSHIYRIDQNNPGSISVGYFCPDTDAIGNVSTLKLFIDFGLGHPYYQNVYYAAGDSGF